MTQGCPGGPILVAHWAGGSRRAVRSGVHAPGPTRWRGCPCAPTPAPAPLLRRRLPPRPHLFLRRAACRLFPAPGPIAFGIVPHGEKFLARVHRNAVIGHHIESLV